MSKRQNYNASITIGSVLENSVKRNIGVLTSGLDKVSNGIKDVERRQKELDKQRAMLRRQGQDVSHLDREYEDLERTLKDLRKAQERWNRAAAASTRVGANFRNMTSDMGRQMRRLSIGAVAAGGAIFGLAASTASLGDDVAKSADKLGFGIEGLQELRYAAERSGVATSSFDSSMLALTKRVGEAAQGFGAGKKALEQLGLKAEDMVKLAPEEQLALIAERLKDIESPAEQAAVASGLFSRAGIGMVNMLRGGSDGLTQLREDAQRTGYVLSEKAARDAEVFQDTLLDTQLAVSGLKNTVGAALMPVVTTAMKQIGDSIIDNHESVEAWSEGFADSVEDALPKAIELASGIGQIGSMVWDVVGATAEMVGGWENFGVVVGTVLAGKTLLTVAKFGTSVFSLGRAMFSLAAATPFVATGIRAIGAALIANPIGLTIAAIAGGAALIYKEWDNVGPWFGELWGGAQTYFSGFSDFVGGVFTGDMTRARNGLETAWDGFSSFHSTMWSGIGSTFKYGYDNLIKPITDALGVTEPIEAAWTGTKVKIGEIFGAIGGFFSDTWETYVSPVITGLKSTESIGAAWEAAKAGLDPVLTWIGDKFAAVMAFISPVIDALKWTYENGTAAVGAVAGALGIGTAGPDLGKEANDDARAPGASGLDQGQQASVQAAQRARLRKLGVPEDKLPPIQKRALGGGFRPGWLLTGEAGPELKFESRAGYIANNRSMRQLAGYADRVGAFMEARSAQTSTKSGRFTDTIKQLSAPQAGGTQQVVQHITNHIHAAGADAQELIRLLEERERRAAGNGLFDRTPALGEFGR